MIPDIIFSLLFPQPGKLVIEDILSLEEISKIFTQGERDILKNIIKIAKQYQSIMKFTNASSECFSTIHVDSTEESFSKGAYLNAFCTGIDQILDEQYTNEIVELENHDVQNPTHSILHIFHKVHAFQPLFTHILKLINGIHSQKLHGCALLQYLHQNLLHGDQKIVYAMKIIFNSVNRVFIKQLTHWILYGKLHDIYGEFFIQSSELRNSSTESEKCPSMTSNGKTVANTVSITDATSSSSYAEVWCYDIYYEFLPHYLSYSWAEKVLFIGQTVLMFKMGVNKTHTIKNNIEYWGEDSINLVFCDSLWDKEEEKYFIMIQKLVETDDVIVSKYEKIIDDIKSYVTEKLSQIAIKQADLIKQLKLIKDFYLLGRGELFLEFIKRTYLMEKSQPVTENTLRDLVKAFDSAANSVNITDELDLFSLSLCKNIVHAFDIESFTYFQHLCLQYKIEWPLHLLLSPKVIERYNELFRFLLLIKKMQYELHMVWALIRKEIIEERVKLMHLLHQLMFFIDNLQYYIQVDVLESQFSILMNTVLNSLNFENIQKAHCIFHTNVLSLCFLLSNEDRHTNIQTSMIPCFENPVLVILNKIFSLCEVFCEFSKSCPSSLTEDDIRTNNILEEQFLKLIKDLMDLLVGLKTAPNYTPLSQLLLRLDFNFWFSGIGDANYHI